jgi:hypothetical protein
MFEIWDPQAPTGDPARGRSADVVFAATRFGSEWLPPWKLFIEQQKSFSYKPLIFTTSVG